MAQAVDALVGQARSLQRPRRPPRTRFLAAATMRRTGGSRAERLECDIHFTRERDKSGDQPQAMGRKVPRPAKRGSELALAAYPTHGI